MSQGRTSCPYCGLPARVLPSGLIARGPPALHDPRLSSMVTSESSDTITGRNCEVVTWADGSGPYEVWDTTTTAAYLCKAVAVMESQPPSISGSFCELIA
jgi:hypothetical protein